MSVSDGYSSTLEVLPVACLILDAEDKILSFNSAATKLLGFNRDKHSGKVFTRFIVNTDAMLFKMSCLKLHETHTNQSCELRLMHNSGEINFCRLDLAVADVFANAYKMASAEPGDKAAPESAHKAVDETRIIMVLTDITFQKKIESTQAFLLSNSWAKKNQNFFETLAEYLSNTLHMEYVCIDKLHSNQEAETVAVYYDGHFEDNIRYTLNDTPCGKVAGSQVCSFPTSVRMLFPKDAFLQQMKAESYVGITLWGTNGKPIGLIAVISRRPINDSRITEIILRQVSIRAAAELEYLDSEAKLKSLIHELEHSRDSLEVKVQDRTRELTLSNKHLRQEIATRKKSESTLVESQNQLRALTRRMDALAEDERKRISHEIHDEIGHLLTALRFDIDSLLESPGATIESLNEEFASINKIIESLIHAIREIATNLRPDILDHLGLIPALQWQVQQFSKRTKICCVSNIDEIEYPFNSMEKTMIFRILQEILTNISRHSKATHVTVNVAQLSETFVMKVTDNGTGFTVDGKYNTNSLGLVGMRERAMSINSFVSIDSAPGKGTSVTFSLKTAVIHEKQ